MKCLLLLAATLSTSTLISIGGENVQIVVISVPHKDAESVRIELNQSEKNSELGSMDGVLKRKGVSLIAKFTQETPWHAEAVEMSKVMGKLGAAERNLEVKLTMEGEKVGEKGEEALTAYIELPNTRKNYRSFSSFGHRFELKTGQWQERAAWGDGRDTIMLWQIVGDDKTTSELKNTSGSKPTRLEMLWLQASKSDLLQMEKATSENRQRAAEWLRGKAQLWKEGCILFKAGDKISWHAADGALALEDGEEIANEIGIYMEGTVSGEGGELNLKFRAEFGAKNSSKKSEQVIEARCDQNTWSFLRIDGVDNCNSLIYRVVTE